MTVFTSQFIMACASVFSRWMIMVPDFTRSAFGTRGTTMVRSAYNICTRFKSLFTNTAQIGLLKLFLLHDSSLGVYLLGNSYLHFSLVSTFHLQTNLRNRFYTTELWVKLVSQRWYYKISYRNRFFCEESFCLLKFICTSIHSKSAYRRISIGIFIW